jgi:hypothetical protein
MSCTATRDGGWGSTGRTGFRPMELAVMIAGFIIFWPLGLAILAYKGWRDGWFMRSARSERRDGDRPAPWGRGWSHPDLRRDSGNLAFEDYKEEELKRLQAEFDRLVEEQRAFGDFIQSLRRAKDKAEFDQFLASRRGGDAGPTQA